MTTMQWALLASLAVHAAALSLHAVDPQAFNRVFEDAPLEVVLVNARSNDAPSRAQA
ncbi:MAG TPA: energy transducer TonB, partial [Rubrivivax sp.]|nr:energy transducer TonB [Rubrivivax sp.]